MNSQMYPTRPRRNYTWLIVMLALAFVAVAGGLAMYYADPPAQVVTPPSPPTVLHDDGMKKELAALRQANEQLQKRLESQLNKQREAIIELAGEVDWLRGETAGALGNQWRTLRSPSARSAAEATLEEGTVTDE